MRRPTALPLLAGLLACLVVAAGVAAAPHVFVLIPAEHVSYGASPSSGDDVRTLDGGPRASAPGATFAGSPRRAAAAPLARDADRAESAARGELGDAALVLDDARLGTYIDEVLLASDSLVTRWPVRGAAPVTYWVQPGAGLAGWTPTHRRMIGEAFTEWNAAALPVRFEAAADSARADLVVLWRGQFDEPISGKTRWTHDRRGWIRTARVTIALRRYTGEPLDPDAVRAIALHEIGHALGLDHTADAANVMAPKVRVRALSDADRATAQLLYRLPAGSLKSR